MPQSLEEWRQLFSIAGPVGSIFTLLLFWKWLRLERKAMVLRISPFDRPVSLNTRLGLAFGWVILGGLTGGVLLVNAFFWPLIK